ncbi:MAG: hypothetical protein BJ554DRAFT_5776 [Olpidium bornovanus]|uniref:GPN-loop GTPase n=1 Tax=Olpidium bornovanus TaxID=278681 RepID=A0A8H7ZZ07_9FUNG|nr:MAG: hypothetical protein BJ554DRAFT_5776 [Olpidium bornovanus]
MVEIAATAAPARRQEQGPAAGAAERDRGASGGPAVPGNENSAVAGGESSPLAGAAGEPPVAAAGEPPVAAPGDPPAAAAGATDREETKPPPTVILCIGMAGESFPVDGHARSEDDYAELARSFFLSVFPISLAFALQLTATSDTVNYKQVMKQYNLGPNGAIVTSLNLFTTKFDQVLNFIEKRAQSIEYVKRGVDGISFLSRLAR